MTFFHIKSAFYILLRVMTGKSAWLLTGCLVALPDTAGVFGQEEPYAPTHHDVSTAQDSLYAAPRTSSGRDLLLKMILKDSSRYETEERIAAMQADLVSHDGKVIRSISIRRVDMFAPSVMDTDYVAGTWLQRTGKRLHTDTRDKIILRNILTGPGEKLDVLLLAENERIIRSLPYIMDARFIVNSSEGDSSSADVVLLVKDLWPIGLGLEISNFDAGNAGFGNANILGFGHQFSSRMYWDGDHKPLFGYDLYYGISNMAGSFVNTQMVYSQRWNGRFFRANLARDFKTTGLKYAGATRLEIAKLQRDIPLLDTTLLEVSTDYKLGELWAGRLFSLAGNRDMVMRSNLFLSGGITRISYHEGPETESDYLYDYQDRTQLMFSIGYSRQGFQKDNHIYTFERTEDVPFGYLVEFMTGREWGQYKNRQYFAGSLSAGNYISGFGYLYGIFQFGTFLHRGESEQGLVNLKMRYFTDLHHGNNFDFRGFASVSYQHLVNPYTGEYITLENGYGIKGLSSPVMRGDEKVVLSLESAIFSPLQLLGFRFVFFVSGDMGLVWNHGTRLSGDDYFSSLGLGIRIRNDRLVFDTFELKLSFYPGQPENARARYWYAGSVPGLKLADFYPGRPSPLN